MTPPKEFFSESDCDIEKYVDAFGAPMSGRIIKGISLSHANEIYEKRIRERSRVVWCSLDAIKGTPLAEVWDGANPRGHTHQALLINIEPIAQPDSAEKFVRDFESAMNQTIKPIGQLGNFIERARALRERKDGV